MAQSRSGKKKKTGRASGILIFLLVFVLFLIIFGGLCLWAVVKINEENRQKHSSQLPSAVSNVAYTEADARNLLVISEDNSEAQGFVVVRMDPANVRIRTMALPRETEVDVGTATTRLFELYKSEGAAQTEKALSDLLKVDFQNYAVVSYDNLAKIVTYLNNGVIYTLPENLNYTSEDGDYSIRLSGGKKTLTASQVVDVLRYPAWHGGRRQQAEIHSELTAAIFNQYMTPSRAEHVDDDFYFFIERLNSDIKISHFNAMKPSLLFLAGRNTDASICTVSKIGGEYSGSGESLRFIVSEEAAVQMQTRFGNTA